MHPHDDRPGGTDTSAQGALISPRAAVSRVEHDVAPAALLKVGAAMAVADAIPMVGPLLATVPAVLMALTRGGPTALAVGIGYVLHL